MFWQMQTTHLPRARSEGTVTNPRWSSYKLCTHTYRPIIHASVIELLMKNLKPVSIERRTGAVWRQRPWRRRRRPRRWGRCGSNRCDLLRLSSSRTAKERDTIMLFWIHNETTERRRMRRVANINFLLARLSHLSIRHRFFACIIFIFIATNAFPRPLPVHSKF